VFPNTGVYFDDTPDPRRWQQISRDTGITLEPQRTKGKNIVICLQRHGGWSMGRISVVDWTVKTIQDLKHIQIELLYYVRTPKIIKQ